MLAFQILGTTFLAATFLLGLTPRFFGQIGRRLGQSIWQAQLERRQSLLERSRAARAAKLPANVAREKDGSGSEDTADVVEDEWLKVRADKARSVENDEDTKVGGAGVKEDFIIGFLHPFTNAGGGGERVLFAALQATQKKYPDALCLVYTSEQNISKDGLLEGGERRFGIALDHARIEFVWLPDGTADLVLPQHYPHFTLLRQSLGSIRLAWRCLSLCVPDVMVETTGYAFALWLVSWLFPRAPPGGTKCCPTAAYVHYPTISTDMLASLEESKGSLQGGLHAGSGTGLRGKLKKHYWQLFARLYGAVGGSIDVVMTNSTWTQNHVRQLWQNARSSRGKASDSIQVVFPPCAVGELEREITVDAESETARTRDILYIAQFRPEKMHHIVIDAFALFLKEQWPRVAKSIQPIPPPAPKLVLAGSVRDPADETRVYKLRLQAHEALASLPEPVKSMPGVHDAIEFVINAPWASSTPPRSGGSGVPESSHEDPHSLLSLLSRCCVGVNGMYNEHFGIGVVEYQAAGLISVVSASGGPKVDIVVDVDGKPTGYHASSVEEFAEGFSKALSMSKEDTLDMRLRARKSAQRFGETVFETAWVSNLEKAVALA
ncbi:glycosyltransferase family 4 protein [Polychaeton citri CBS 116435]|uniref:GDP-Man:Man(3)GlcNAc(2)-PP-Dol alpha-1,2-mannosyltransferase n=1 Tax=Polychaeton citri CBS 116435 TaxID=1314669 RepID=A0A9P4UQ54_9PEZI|nr:glycosyltransferase family 4 protein [Polychaeton citri CBS 116435]